MSENKFDYTYSAPTEEERREIESIRKQYTASPEKEDKLEKLRRLNTRVTRPPFVIGLTLGVLGTLVLGLGMTMVLEWNITAWGVVVGALGIAIDAVAYPLYRAILSRNKRKYGKLIIELSDELLNGRGDMR
ncbi:MAG: hypothetical protein K2L72_01675 [Clostridia bacterium]|nr:hypothetical protein [Clostridia bacterium]